VVTKFVSHSKKVIDIARCYGWLPAARYTNLRDIRHCEQVGFVDVDWKNYSFSRHLEAVRVTKPLMTVARDIERMADLERILDQAYQLTEHAQYVIVVPKHPSMGPKLGSLIPKLFVLGYSVPTKYGGTKISPEMFTRPVHLLGGRPEVQRELAERMRVVSVDCNRFTLDAAFGDYFDGEKFRPHPRGGYFNCIRDSIRNINNLWSSYATRSNIDAG
jgi:hypothetical protein